MQKEFLVIADCLDLSNRKGFFAEFSVVEKSSEAAIERLRMYLEEVDCNLRLVESVELFAENTDLEPSVEQVSGRSYFSDN